MLGTLLSKFIRIKGDKKMQKTILIGGVIADAPLRELRIAIHLKAEEMISLALSGDNSIELFTIEEDDDNVRFTVRPANEPNTTIMGVYYINSDGRVCVRKIEF